MKKRILVSMFVFLMFLVIMTIGVSAEYPATFVDLGNATNFTVLSKAGITFATATINITGDIGVSPVSGTSITGGDVCPQLFPVGTPSGRELNGTIWQPDAGLTFTCAVNGTANGNEGKNYVDDAVLDLAAAHTATMGGANTPATGAAFLNLGAGTLTARTLTPGVYTWGTNLDITGDITLDCGGDPNEVFVFQVNGNLDLATTKKIILAGSCQASRVFWGVTGTTALNTDSHLEGTIITGPDTVAITMIAGATTSVNGRLLGEKAIALQDNNTVIFPTDTGDTTAPAISLSKSSQTRNTITVDFSCTDPGAGVSTCVLSGPSGSVVSGNKIAGLSCGTSHDITVTTTDSLGNEGNKTSSMSTQACGGGGGSGGGGVVPQPAIASHSWDLIIPGVAAVMTNTDFDSESSMRIGVRQITINVNNPAQNVKITVTKYDGKPAAVSVAKSGKVYQYLQIDAQNLGANFGTATVQFRVEKSWVASNSLTKDRIAVYRFDGASSKWNELQTTASGEDSTHYFYDVELDRFSYFAISERSLAAGEGTTATGEGTTTAGGSAEEGRSMTWLWILIVAVIVIAVLVGVAMKRRTQ